MMSCCCTYVVLSYYLTLLSYTSHESVVRVVVVAEGIATSTVGVLLGVGVVQLGILACRPVCPTRACPTRFAGAARSASRGPRRVRSRPRARLLECCLSEAATARRPVRRRPCRRPQYRVYRTQHVAQIGGVQVGLREREGAQQERFEEIIPAEEAENVAPGVGRKAVRRRDLATLDDSARRRWRLQQAMRSRRPGLVERCLHD